MARYYTVHSTRKQAERQLIRDVDATTGQSQTLFVVPGDPPLFLTGPTSGARDVALSGAVPLMSLQAHKRDCGRDCGFCYEGGQNG